MHRALLFSSAVNSVHICKYPGSPQVCSRRPRKEREREIEKQGRTEREVRKNKDKAGKRER